MVDQYTGLIVLAIGYIVILGLDIWHDWYRSVKRLIDIHHPSDTINAAIIYILYTLYIGNLYGVPWSVEIASLAILAGIRWIVHDGGLNLARGYSFDYLGDGIDDAFTDKLLKSFNINPWTFKGIFLAVAIIASLTLIKLTT